MIRMIGTIGQALAAVLLLALAGTDVSAQDVIMNSAETINVGNVKLAFFPTALLGKNGSGTDWGMAGRLGLGLTPRFDVEAKGAIFDGLNYYGGDAEVWLVRGRQVNVSIGGGAHLSDYEGSGDVFGVDATLIVSTHAHRHLELYGGLKLALESPDAGDNYTLAHLVPGLEYRVSRDLDFLAEIGLAVNDRSRSYASIGLAYYFR